MARTGGRRERAHRPTELGPRLIRRGRYFACDLRPWSMGRPTLRNPGHPSWPEKGERTEHADVAERWRWSYYELAREGKRKRQLGIPAERRLGDAVQAYLAHRETNVEGQTHSLDIHATGRLLEALGDRRFVHDITKDDIQKLVDARLQAGYSVWTVRTLRRYLALFFRWAQLEPNPAQAASVPKEPRTEIFTWSDAQIDELRKASIAIDELHEGRYARRLIDAGLATGVRFRELLTLRWDDFDTRTRTVRVRRQADGYYLRTKPPKGGKARTAVVLPWWWDQHQQATGYLFPDGDKFIGSKTAERTLKDVLEAAKLSGPRRSFHDLRRTYGRLFLEAGGWMDELQRSLGHQSIKTTERAYGHFHEAVAAQFAIDRIYGEGRQRRLRIVGEEG